MNSQSMIAQDRYTLYHGDYRDILGSLRDIDVVITDPPYGEKTHRGARTGGNGHSDPSSGKEQLIHFASLNDDRFIQFCTDCVDLAKRWVIMTCEWQHAAKIEASGLPIVRLGCWIKSNAAPQFSGDRPGTGWEAVAILHRSGKKRWNGGGRHAVWDVPKVHGEHPTTKPQRLLQRWVMDFTDEGETILDPMMGSGSTGIAALSLNRKFVGIEIDKTYFDLACHRIHASQQQQRLLS